MWSIAKSEDSSLLRAGMLIQGLPVLLNLSDKTENNFSKIPYSILISPACDIESCLRIMPGTDVDEFGRQVIFQLMFCPAFEDEIFMKGEHLLCYNKKTLKPLKQKEFDSLKNQDRYCRIKGSGKIPDLIVDFKHYFTLPVSLVLTHNKSSEENHILEHIYYTQLSDKFAYYLQRVSIP